MTAKISSGLMAATRSALEILHRHYPRKFALAMQHTDDAAQFVSEYAQALTYCDFDKIPQAARQWVATSKYAPTPAELGEIARELTFAARPAMPAPTSDGKVSPFHRAKPLWYAKPGPASGYGRLDAEHAIAFTLTTGGTLNIGDVDMDKIHGHEIAWGWMRPADVPRMAAPDEFFASWQISTRADGAA